MIVPINGAFGSMPTYGAYGDYGAYGASSWLAKRRKAATAAKRRAAAAARKAMASAAGRGYMVPTTSAAQAGSDAWSGRTRVFQKPGFMEKYQALPTVVKAGAAGMLIPGVGPLVAAGILGKGLLNRGRGIRDSRGGPANPRGGFGFGARGGSRVGSRTTGGPGWAQAGSKAAWSTPTAAYEDAFAQQQQQQQAAESTEMAPTSSTPSYGLMALGALLLGGVAYAVIKRKGKGKGKKSKK